MCLKAAASPTPEYSIGAPACPGSGLPAPSRPEQAPLPLPDLFLEAIPEVALASCVPSSLDRALNNQLALSPTSGHSSHPSKCFSNVP